MSLKGTKFILYHYYPSEPAAIVFIVLFSLTTSAHIFQLARGRTWYFVPFVIGGFFELIGYAGRAWSATQSPNWTTPPYIVQSRLLLVAPALFAASIYLILSRIILLTDGAKHALVRPRWITMFFVAGDVISFLAQSAGGGLLGSAHDQKTINLGNHIIVGGLGIQLAFGFFFSLVTATFHLRIRQTPTAASAKSPVPWQRYLLVLYTVSILIMIRSVFRIVEYVMGFDGPLLSTEAHLYVFDARLMFVCMRLLNLWHPSRIVNPRLDIIRGAGEDVEMLPEAQYKVEASGEGV